MTDDNPFNDDPEYQAMKDEAILEHQRTANDWVNVMNTESGRRVIIDLLNQTGYMCSVFDKNNSEQSRKAGKSELGFYIQGMLAQHAPKSLIEIMTNDSNLFANDS